MAVKAWMPGTIRAFAPVFDGLRPGMMEKVGNHPLTTAL